MPRIARGLADGHFYHIINRGNCRQEIFHKREDYAAFADLLKESADRHEVGIYSWCIMPNHFHLLARPEKAENLSSWIQWFMTSHVRRYHKHYQTSGHVWQGRFKSFIVQDDAHLLTVARYIEGNPVRWGLVSTATDWEWSSHRFRIGKTVGFEKELPLPLPAEWTRYVDLPVTDVELEKLRKSVNRQTPYGLEGWQEQMAKTLGLFATLNPRGRPRKSVPEK